MPDFTAYKPKPNPADADYALALRIFNALSHAHKVLDRVSHRLADKTTGYEFVSKDPRVEIPQVFVILTGDRITEPDTITIKGDYLAALGAIELSRYAAMV